MGVDPNFIPSILEKKVSKGITPWIEFLEKVRIKIFSLSKKFAPWFINFVKRMRLAEIYRKLNNKKRLTEKKEVIYELYKFYRENVCGVESLIGRELNGWKSE